MPDPIYSKPRPWMPVWAQGSPKEDSINTPYAIGKGPASGSKNWIGELPPMRQAGETASGIPQRMSMAGKEVGSFAAEAGMDWGSIGNAAKSIVPFASNIANAFRKPPKPIRGGMLSPVTLSRVSNDNERANIDAVVRGNDMAADRSLDGNTASAVRAANLSGKLRAYGDSYSREQQANVGIANQQAQINSGIQERNVRTNDAYNQQLIESQIANQRAQSENISNAADKFQQIQNNGELRDLDERKWGELSRLYDGNLGERYQQYLRNKGLSGSVSGGQRMRMGGKIKAFKK